MGFAASIYLAGCAAVQKPQTTQYWKLEQKVLAGVGYYDPSPRKLAQKCASYGDGQTMFVYTLSNEGVIVIGRCKDGKPHGKHDFTRRTTKGYESCDEHYQNGNRISGPECKPIKCKERYPHKHGCTPTNI